MNRFNALVDNTQVSLQYMKSIEIINAFLAILLILMSASISAENWFAMSRHGECISFEQLSKRVGFFKNVKSLEDLKSNIESQDLDYSLQSTLPEIKEIYRLEVPARSISMLITTNEVCNKLM